LVGVVVLAAVALPAAGCGSSKKHGVAGPSEVSLQRTSSPTANPFTPPVGKDTAGIKPPPAAVSQGPSTYNASLPGLYGGTRNSATCNTAQLVTYLESSTGKAKAWSDALQIRRSQIRSYVSALTPVLLRTDTRVTNHGFVNGVADPIPALLEAGTAVLVDSYGTPVVKCYCGNPLTAAVPLTSPTYYGPRWAGFSPGHITIIHSSTTIIDTFTLYDPRTGKTFTRPAGTDGRRDGPFTGTATGTTTTTPAPQPPGQPPQTAPSQTTPAQSEHPTASFSPSAGHLGDTFTLSASGFAPNTSLQATLTRPDGVVEHYAISTGSDGSGSFTFGQAQRVPLGTYTAVVRNPSTGAAAQASTSVSA